MGFALIVLFVIFGGGYYLIRYLLHSGEEAGKKRAYEISKTSRNAAFKEFEERVIDREYESHIREVLDRGGEEAERLKLEVDEFVNHEKWLRSVPQNNDHYIRVLLAKNGKISCNETAFGIRPYIHKEMKEYQIREAYEDYGLLQLWVANQLQRHGIEATPVQEISFGNYEYLTEDNIKGKSFKWEASLDPISYMDFKNKNRK